MLLHEALTLAILTSLIPTTHALPWPFPQQQQANTSGSPVSAKTASPPGTSAALAHTEITVSGISPPSVTHPGGEPLTVHVESSVQELNPSTLTSIALPYAHSEVPVSALTANNNPTQGGGNNNPTQGGGNNNPQGGNNAPTALSQNAPGPQPTSGGDIINVIVSQINNQPAPPAATTGQGGQQVQATNNNNNNNNPQAQQTGTGAQQQVQATGQPQVQASGSGAMQTANGLQLGASQTQGSPQTVPAAITIGTNALTLTNGLSTVLGSGSATTLVELTTNSAGQTIVVVGSSTSTVLSTASRSGTQMLTGTKAAGASTAAAAATTSKKGAAASVKWSWGLEAWAGVSVGLLGLAIVL